MLWDWLMNVYAWTAALVFLLFPLLWIIGYAITGNKKRSSRLAADISMIFLIGAIAAFYDGFFNTNNQGFWVIILVLLILAGFIGNMQNRIKGKIDPIRIARAVWRLGFLLLILLYILILLIKVIILIIGMLG